MNIPIIVLLLAPVHAHALPDMPIAKVQPARPVMEGRFLDNPAKVALGANVALFSLDAAQTCHNLANGGREHYLPTQSCAGAVGIMGAEMGALWLGARLAHQRHWHKLERAFEWAMPVINTKAIIYSKEHGAL